MTCSVKDCGDPTKALGYCYKHYMRFYRKGTTEGADQPVYESDQCGVASCSRPRFWKTYCSAHSARLQRHGDLQEHIPIREPGHSKWTQDKKGYMRRHVRINGRSTTVMQHREVMENHLGRKLLSGEEVHHVNGDKQNNKIRNLELWSTSQPAGQRVEDKVAWAIEILELYGRDFTQPKDRLVR